MARKPKLTKEEVMAAADRAEGMATPSDDGPRNPGRQSTYNPEFAAQAEKLCALGATDIEIAQFFDISDRTLYRWKLKYPELCQSLKVGKEAADERVIRSLYHKATGYTFSSEKVFQFQGEIVRAKTVEHVPPDTTACIFWLKNRRPEDWREKVDVEHSGSVALGDRLGNSLKRLEEQPVAETQH